MGLRDDLCRDEEQGYEELVAAIRAVPRERLEEPILRDGWSVRDVVWHVACWHAECAHALERVRLGTYEGWEEDTDALNERFLEEGRRHGLDTARAMLAAARNRMLQELWAFPGDPPGEAVEWFVESGVEHYREHLADVRGALEMRGPEGPGG